MAYPKHLSACLPTHSFASFIWQVKFCIHGQCWLPYIMLKMLFEHPALSLVRAHLYPGVPYIGVSFTYAVLLTCPVCARALEVHWVGFTTLATLTLYISCTLCIGYTYITRFMEVHWVGYTTSNRRRRWCQVMCAKWCVSSDVCQVLCVEWCASSVKTCVLLMSRGVCS